MKKSLYLAVLLILASCEKEVELDIPHSPQQLVVSGILMPTEDIEVNVSLSQYVMDTSITIVSDAEVYLYCENELVAQLQHTENGRYTQLGLKPIVEQTYSISVSVIGFETATAQTTVPLPVFQDSIVFVQGVGGERNGLELSTIDMYFNRNSETENYYSYRVSGESDSIFRCSIDYLGDTTHAAWERGSLTNFHCYHPAILKEGDETTRFFSDKWSDSEGINLKVYFSIFDWHLKPDTSYTYEIKSQVIALSKEYYLFQKSYKNYNEKQGQILGDNNLPRLYSNVSNALGCFSSINPGNIIVQEKEVEWHGWQ